MAQHLAPYVGARMTEYFAEMQMECKRRLGPAHGQGCSDWITSTHINHRSQIARAETGHPHRPRERECPEVLTPEELKRASTIGISVAIQLLALCCPQTIPSTSLSAQVPLLTQQYKNWSASTRNILVFDGETPESDDEWSDEDQHHQGCVFSFQFWVVLLYFVEDFVLGQRSVCLFGFPFRLGLGTSESQRAGFLWLGGLRGY